MHIHVSLTGFIRGLHPLMGQKGFNVHSHGSVLVGAWGFLPEERSSLAAGGVGWQWVAAPGGLEELEAGGRGPAPSPASAEGWACFPESTSPGSGGRCLEGKMCLFIHLYTFTHFLFI